ncbi:MAG: hypothetical protein ACRD32_07575, partial [Nitrososphaerales archaeon]
TITTQESVISPIYNTSPLAINSQPVTVKSTSYPSGFTLTLTETDIDTSTFTGQLILSSLTTNAATGTILVAGGDFVSVSDELLETSNGLVVPNPDSSRGAILTNFPVGGDIVTATYLSGVFVTAEVSDQYASGGGGGGLVRPGMVLNVLAGIGGSGRDTSPPSLVFSKPSVTGLSFIDTILGTFSIDPYEPIEPSTDSSANAPVIINDNRFYPTGYASTFVPTPVNTGEDVDLTLDFLEYSSVKHVAVHFVDENNDEMSETDPTITYDNGNVIKSDPDGILGDEITFSTSDEGFHSKFNFGFSFDEPTKRHLMITAWDETRNSANTKMFNAFEVTGEPIPEEVGRLILQDLGQYIITQDGVIDVQAKNAIQQEPVVGFAYEESLGRLDRHDMTKLYGAVDYEQKRAGDLIIDNLNL